MFDWQFLRDHPEFKDRNEDQLTLLSERMIPRPLDEIIKDDDELDSRVQSEKKKIPRSPEAVVFARGMTTAKCWFTCPFLGETIQIIDVIPNHVDDALQLIVEQYIPIEPLCKAMRISEDEVGLREYVHQIEYFLNGAASFVALDSQGQLIGVLVGKWEDLNDCTEKLVEKTDFQSNRLRTIHNLLNFLNRTVDVHAKYDCKTYFRLYIIAVCEKWRNKGIEKALITGAMIFCQYHNIPLIGGSFTFYKDQQFIERFGGKKDFEIYFSEWRSDRGLRIFRGTGRTEPKIMWMTLPIIESFTPSFDPKTILPPLSTERARRIIKDRLLIWEDLDIYRACQCRPEGSGDKFQMRKTSMKKRQSQSKTKINSQRGKDRVVFTS